MLNDLVFYADYTDDTTDTVNPLDELRPYVVYSSGLSSVSRFVVFSSGFIQVLREVLSDTTRHKVSIRRMSEPEKALYFNFLAYENGEYTDTGGSVIYTVLKELDEYLYYILMCKDLNDTYDPNYEHTWQDCPTK